MPQLMVHSEDDEEIDSETVSLIEKTVSFVLEQEHQAEQKMGLVFVSKELLKDYNEKYRNQHYYPDILSFVSDEDGYLGDILLCREIICIQAKTYNVPIQEELMRLIIHGILHLLGYSHTGYHSSQTMLQKQEFFLQKIKEKETCSIL